MAAQDGVIHYRRASVAKDRLHGRRQTLNTASNALGSLTGGLVGPTWMAWATEI